MLSQAEIDALLRSLSEAPDPVPDLPELPAGEAPPARQPPPRRALPSGFDLLLGVEVTCSVDLGETVLELGELLSLGRSSLVVLAGRLDAPLVLRINGVPFAHGTVVETNGRYGLRITEFAHAQEEAHA